MARQSIVLLKNEDLLLPLNRNKIKRIAVVGSNADDKSVLLANYYGYPKCMVWWSGWGTSYRRCVIWRL